MTPLEFWTTLFSGQIRAVAPDVDAGTIASVLSDNHQTLYGGYLGPSSLDCTGNGCVWIFDRCAHGECIAICDGSSPDFSS